MADAFGLSEIEFVWLIAWNIADGEWDRIGLGQEEGRELLLDLFGKLHGDSLEAAKESRARLEQRLMALRQSSFEEMQKESPFSRHAQRNMEILLRAWKEEGAAGFGRAWNKVFRPGWEATRETQDPIQIVGGTGDCEERALEVKGAPDTETRVAAEWWYLYNTFGQGWTPGMHFTTVDNESGAHFSVHNIEIHPDSRKQIYFRLPW